MNCLSIATGNRFFRLSPEDYKGLHQRYAATMQLAGESDSKPNDNEEKDEERTRLETELASAFPLLMAWLWRQKDLKPEELKTEQVQQFIRTHAAVLDHAVDTAIKETPLDEISVQRLKESNYVFSGIKTFHELKEAFPSLVGADGNIKPFEQFLAEVRRVHKTYNRQYLQAEYHLAQSSASMAARWKKFEKDGDRYLLQYRTIGDKRVRPTHRDLHGITLPINSKFWDEYFPPNNWNCRCSVVQVRRSKYTQSDEAEAMRLGLKATAGKYREMFLFNPGKTMTCFPMYNAYTRKACIDCKKKPGNLELAADVPDNELCKACAQIHKSYKIKRRKYDLNKRLYYKYLKDPNYEDVYFDEKTGGVTAKHILHNFDERGGEYEKNVRDAGVAAGHAVIFGAERGITAKSTEGRWNGLLFEVAGRETGTINNIKRGLEHCADKRQTEVAILDFPLGNFNLENLQKAIARYKGLEKLADGQFVKFKKIICTQNKRIVYEADF